MNPLQLQDLEVVDRPLDARRPDPGNPRHHPRKQIRNLVKSIRSSRYVSPILIDEEFTIIAGHGRLAAEAN